MSLPISGEQPRSEVERRVARLLERLVAKVATITAEIEAAVLRLSGPGPDTDGEHHLQLVVGEPLRDIGEVAKERVPAAHDSGTVVLLIIVMPSTASRAVISSRVSRQRPLVDGQGFEHGLSVLGCHLRESASTASTSGGRTVTPTAPPAA